MKKRGVIHLSGTPKIRISKPGVDVDLATPTEFLLHESHLYAQPYYSSFVTCPFAGNTSGSLLQQAVNVTVPDVTAEPIVLLWPVDSAGTIISPMSRTTGPGSSQTGWVLDFWRVDAKVVNSTRVDVRFTKTADSRRSPNGAYLILLRRPS